MAEKSAVSPDAAAATIYFGFGSNICKGQVKTRCPTSEYLGIARLPGYRWFIAALGGANIIKGSEDDEVWGMAYRLQPRDEEALDILERVPTHFVKEIIEAQLWEPAGDGRPADPTTQAPREVGVLVYISHERTAVGQPRAEYVVRMNRAIVDALKEGIPSAYVDNVLRKSIPPADVQ